MDHAKRDERIAFFIEIATTEARWMAFHERIPMLTPVRWRDRGTIQHGVLAGGKNGTLTSAMSGSYWTYYLYVFPEGQDSEKMMLETELEYFINGAWLSYENAITRQHPANPMQEAAALIARLSDQNRTLRKMAIKRIEVSHTLVWLAEHYDNVDYPRDDEEGCLFWMSLYPEGFNQEFDSSVFREELREDWNTLTNHLNSARREGYCAVRLVEAIS